MEKGIIYIASGDKYIESAKKSARSVKKYNNSLPITIYSDRDVKSKIFDNNVKLNKQIGSMGDSILSENNFPYERNIYLDVDTHICGDLSPLFTVLDEFDLAVAQAFLPQSNEKNIPDTFPELNTGVIAYTDTHSVHELFENWQEEYEQDSKNGFSANQPAFRRSLYESDINFTILPDEYNCRTLYSGSLINKAKIVHGWHNQPIKDVASKINETSNPRIYFKMRDEVSVFSPSKASIKDWVLLTMATDGIITGLFLSLRMGFSLFREDK